MKSTLSLLFIIVLLNSCCNCDCPEEGTAVIPNISETTETPEISAPSNIVDTVKDETGSLEGQAVNKPVEEKKEVQSGKKEETKETNKEPKESNTAPFENSTEVNPSLNSGDGLSGNESASEIVVETDDMEDSPIRRRLNDVDLSGIKSDADYTITLQIAIDGAGNVSKASVIKSKTTTTDQSLINEVISAVKNQVKYTRNTGAALKYEVYTAQIKAN